MPYGTHPILVIIEDSKTTNDDYAYKTAQPHRRTELLYLHVRNTIVNNEVAEISSTFSIFF
jgi:hypothetical protein